MESEPRPAAGRWVRPAVAAALFAGAALLYARSLPYPFLSLDDPDYVASNPHVNTGLTAANINWALTTGHGANWHPLTWLSLQLDATLWGGADSAWGFRLTNVLLHAANSVLVFLFLVRATGLTGRSAVVAAVWAAHPLHVESVVWVTERKDVLSMFFGLLSLLAYVGYARRPGVGRYLAMAALLALGLATKPMLVTLPCVFLLLDYWPLGRTRWAAPAGPPAAPATPARLLAEKMPLVAVVVGSAVLTMIVQSRAGAVGSLHTVGPGDRAAGAAVSYGMYLWQTVWPADLTVFYPRVARSPADPGALAAVAAVAALTGLAVGFGRRFPYLPVGWLWFAGTLVPVVGFVQIGGHDRADRYTYLPHVGLFLAGVWGAADLLRRWPVVRAGAAVLAVGGAAGFCWVQIGYWRSAEDIWRHTLAVTGPANALGQLSLGFVFREAGQREAALAAFQAAADLDPRNPYARTHLGTALADSGRENEAIPYLVEAIRVEKNRPQPKQILGRVLVLAGRSAEAAPYLKETGENDWLGIAATVVRARDALDRADVAAARPPLTRLVAAAPHLVEPRFLLGVCDDLDGQPEAAARNLREAVRVKSWYAPAHARLALVLNRFGDRPGAVAEAEEAVRLAPADPDAQAALGLVLLNAGRSADARKAFAEVVRLAPDWPAAVGERAWRILTGPSHPTGVGAARDAARQACEASGYADPPAVAALAAAEAAAGRYREAAELADRAAAAADKIGRPTTAEEYRRHGDLYRAGKPLRDRP